MLLLVAACLVPSVVSWNCPAVRNPHVTGPSRLLGPCGVRTSLSFVALIWRHVLFCLASCAELSCFQRRQPRVSTPIIQRIEYQETRRNKSESHVMDAGPCSSMFKCKGYGNFKVWFFNMLNVLKLKDIKGVVPHIYYTWGGNFTCKEKDLIGLAWPTALHALFAPCGGRQFFCRAEL